MSDCLGYIGIDIFTWYQLLYCIYVTNNLIFSVGALCYAEIGTVIPRNGAEVAYMKEGRLIKINYFRISISKMDMLTDDLKKNLYFLIGIGSVHERTGDILAYLYIWTSTFIIKPATIAVLSLTFSQYFLSGIMSSK